MKLALKGLLLFPSQTIAPNLAKLLPFMLSPEKLAFSPDDKPKLNACRSVIRRFALNSLIIRSVPVMNPTKSTIKLRGRFP